MYRPLIPWPLTVILALVFRAGYETNAFMVRFLETVPHVDWALNTLAALTLLFGVCSWIFAGYLVITGLKKIFQRRPINMVLVTI